MKKNEQDESNGGSGRVCRADSIRSGVRSGDGQLGQHTPVDYNPSGKSVERSKTLREFLKATFAASTTFSFGLLILQFATQTPFAQISYMYLITLFVCGPCIGAWHAIAVRDAFNPFHKDYREVEAESRA